MTIRIGVAMASHESGTFNPTPTTVADFVALGVHAGPDLVADGGAAASVAGFLDVVDGASGVEPVGVWGAHSVPGGPVSPATIEFLADGLMGGLDTAGHLDALVVFLHGACAGVGMDDVDGHLLGLLRARLGPDVPIVLGLDHHANVTAAMVAGCDLLVGHRTQPHDLPDTGRVAARHALALVSGAVTPVVAWRKLPLISHQEQYLSSVPPMATWFERARDLEQEPAVLQVSNFPMQPWLDVEEGGWSTVVYTDGDQGLADRLADELADLAWSLRAEFQVRTSVPVSEAVTMAAAADRGVVVLSDTGDSVLGGAGGDSTTILSELLAQDIAGPAYLTLVEPEVARLVAGREVGERVSLMVGGAVAGMHPSVEVAGTIRHLGRLVVGVDGFWSDAVDHGFTCVLETSFGALVLTELRGLGGVHPAVYRHVGLDPTDARMVVVKTASNFQFFADLTSEVIRVDTPGPTQSDLASLAWERMPRPIYPLDDVPTWR